MKQQMKQRKRHLRRGVVERDFLFLLLSFDKEAIFIVSFFFFFFFFFFFKWKMTLAFPPQNTFKETDETPLLLPKFAS